MSDLRDESVGWPSHNPFATEDCLLVGPSCFFSFSLEGMANEASGEASVAEAHLRPCDHSSSGHTLPVLPVCCVFGLTGDSLSPRPRGADTSVQSDFLPNCVRELCERCRFNSQGLVHFLFAVSSNLQHISAAVFCETHIEAVTVPDSVVELDRECFSCYQSLRYLRFGMSSKLERIGDRAFRKTNIECVSIPDSVVELGKECFWYCVRLHYVAFGMSSKLERIGDGAFGFTRLRSLFIPDGVVELCKECFSHSGLHNLAFGGASKLERIGAGAFWSTCVTSVAIPSSVVCLCKKCFYACDSLRYVTFGASSNLESIGADAFSYTSLVSLMIPDNVVDLSRSFHSFYKWFHVTFSSSSKLARISAAVCDDSIVWLCSSRCRFTQVPYLLILEVYVPDSCVELADRCFYYCPNVRRVVFGSFSNLQHIGYMAFSKSSVESISIPNSVVELDRACFSQSSLCHLTFGAPSRLERICGHAFRETCVESVSIPDSVVKLGDKCFWKCRNLRYFTIGAASKLQRIGAGALRGTRVESVSIPDSVVKLGDKCFYQCEELQYVILGLSSSLKWIGEICFARSSLTSFRFPCSVVRVGGGVFHTRCGSCEVSCSESCGLVVQDFLLFDNLARVCYGCTGMVCMVRDVSIPNSVCELSDRCFYHCTSLSTVTFCCPPHLARLGAESFCGTRVELFSVPESVVEVCRRCF